MVASGADEDVFTISSDEDVFTTSSDEAVFTTSSEPYGLVVPG